MKSTFKILLLIVALVPFLIQCEKEEPEPDPKVEIPDDSFLNALIKWGVDLDEDGMISPEEAEVVTSLDINGWNEPDKISDLTGIEAFINLESLSCYDNLLSTLDVSNNTLLAILDCWGNQLTTLDLSKNTALVDLNCCDNHLSFLDVSNNTNLKYLRCEVNQLTTLDVSNNTALVRLWCERNQLIHT